MEAPEKIYVPTVGDELHYHMTCPRNEFKESIEYIRKDAFIEKACKFFERPRIYKITGTGLFVDVVDELMIKDFKKYLEELL